MISAFKSAKQAASQDPDAQKKRKRTLISIAAVILALSIVTYIKMPKRKDISKSEYFTEQQVKDALEETVGLLDAGDYEALRQNSSSEMQQVFQEETIESAKEQIAASWGGRQRFDNMYVTELVQQSKHFAIGEVTVTYEQVSVTYRITYDEEMKIAGLYMK